MMQVVMPQMGESLAEGTVVRWLKRPGDPVALDEPLFEITTDKVDTDVPSPVAGVLASILVQEGETVAVGAAVATIDEVGATAPAPKTGAADPPASVAPLSRESAAVAVSAATAAPATTEPEPASGHFKSSHAPQTVSFRRGGAAPTASPVAPPNRSYSPAVLGAARAGGVPLETITSLRGSGRGGRLTKRDVARFLEAGGGRTAGAPAAALAGGAPVQAPARADLDAMPPEYRYRPVEGDVVTPMSVVRKRIAHHMAWSTRISPHASAFVECDVTNVVTLVKQVREAFNARVGAPLTYTVIAAEAVAHTLREFPSLNASVVDDALVIKPRVHLGIAVALADTDDLIVPVIRDADGLSIDGLARAIADLAGRARTRRLKPEDVQGGTFTLTNPGMFGGLTGTPILNQPQVGIIGLGAIVRRAVVIDDDSIVPRSMMTVALTFDHRAADGMMAFKFLEKLRARLEAGPPGLRT